MVQMQQNGELDFSKFQYQEDVDFPKLKLFLVESKEWLKVCTVIKALRYKIQKSSNPKTEIATFFQNNDLFDTQNAQQGPAVLDHLMRSADKMVRGHLFELLAALSAFSDGKKYLLQKIDLVEMLIADLTAMDASQCSANKTQTSEAQQHRMLVQILFKLSQSRGSHAAIFESTSLTPWILCYLWDAPSPPLPFIRSTVEAATGLLQNISLKNPGIEKLIQSKPAPLPILLKLLHLTSINCDNPEKDLLTLMAATYTLSVMYQIAKKRQGKLAARSIGLTKQLQARIGEMCALYDQKKGHQVDQALLVQLESICDVLVGTEKSSLASNEEESVNTSLDDCWSDDDSDESDQVDWEDMAFEPIQISDCELAQQWLQEEFRSSTNNDKEQPK